MSSISHHGFPLASDNSWLDMKWCHSNILTVPKLKFILSPWAAVRALCAKGSQAKRWEGLVLPVTPHDTGWRIAYAWDVFDSLTNKPIWAKSTTSCDVGFRWNIQANHSFSAAATLVANNCGPMIVAAGVFSRPKKTNCEGSTPARSAVIFVFFVPHLPGEGC